MDVTLLGLRAVSGLGWLGATLLAGLAAVLLAGFVARRLPLRRGRWLVAALGLLVVVTTAPSCSTQQVDDDSLRTSCGAVAGTVTARPQGLAAASRLQALLLGVALAAGVAPVAVPVVRLRQRAG